MGTCQRHLNPRLAAAAVLLCIMLDAGAAIAEEKEKAAQASPAPMSSVRVVRPGRLRLGGISIGGFYSHHPRYGYGYYGPFYYPYSYYGPYYGSYLGPYGWPFYDFYAPVYDPALYSGFVAAPRGGEVKLQVKPKTAEVYINGSYAGLAGDLKSFRLEPAAYDLEIKAENHAPFQRRIYVLTGKTLKVDATLKPESKEAKP